MALKSMADVRRAKAQLAKRKQQRANHEPAKVLRFGKLTMSFPQSTNQVLINAWQNKLVAAPATAFRIGGGKVTFTRPKRRK